MVAVESAQKYMLESAVCASGDAEDRGWMHRRDASRGGCAIRSPDDEVYGYLKQRPDSEESSGTGENSLRRKRKTALGTGWRYKDDDVGPDEWKSALMPAWKSVGCASGNAKNEDSMRRQEAHHGWCTRRLPDEAVIGNLGFTFDGEDSSGDRQVFRLCGSEKQRDAPGVGGSESARAIPGSRSVVGRVGCQQLAAAGKW